MTDSAGWSIGKLTQEELAAIGDVAVQSAYLGAMVHALILRLSKLTVAEGDAFLTRAMLDAKLTGSNFGRRQHS
jgi:hypothetical protein